MACQCVSAIQKVAIGTKLKRGVIVGADFKHISLYVPQGSNELSTRTFSEMSLKVDDRVKEFTQSVIHKFCPFCGIEYGKLAELPTSV